MKTSFDHTCKKHKLVKNDNYANEIPSLKDLSKMSDSIKTKTFLDDKTIENEILPKIFTKDINEILNLLYCKQKTSDFNQTLFALIRVYLAYFEKSKYKYQFSHEKFSVDGKTMLYNIFKCYISQFKGNMNSLFNKDNKYQININLVKYKIIF